MTPGAPHLLWVNQFALLPGDGGGTRHFEIGRELVRSGWEVTVAASDFHLHGRNYTRRPDARHRAPVEEVVDGVRMRWHWAAPYRNNDWRRIRNWVSFGRSLMHDAPAVGRPSVVIGSSPQLLGARAALRLADRLGVPFVLEVRDLWPESMVAVGARKGPAYYFLDRIARHLYRRAELIVVLARGSGDYLARRGVPEERLVYVPNGVDVDAFPPHVGSGKEEPFTLVYAGAHGPANGLEVVLDAAQELGDPEDVRFLLVGDGPTRAHLMAEAERRGLRSVEFRPAVPKPELIRILSRADAGLMLLRPSPLFEFGVSPNKLFDYMAAALPVVCNVGGEVQGILAGSGGGVQTMDSGGTALAEAVQRLRSLPPEERERMGLSGRRWVEGEHARPVLAARLRSALEPLLS